MTLAQCDTPIGQVELCFSGRNLTGLCFVESDHQHQKIVTQRPLAGNHDHLIITARAQLQCYFKNPEFAFDLPIQFNTGTDFEQRVWRALQAIPNGETLTYGALAKRLNTGARAIGNACRKNPIPIIIPCHRIVAANGLGGYTGVIDGRLINIKRFLLGHENKRM